MSYERSIFVFGSNRQGRHGKGAALAAVREHGAYYGQATGLQGSSYAIVTKDLRRGLAHRKVTLQEIRQQVERLIDLAVMYPEWEFNVTAIGCGLAGFKPEKIAPMFAGAPDNVKLPHEFLAHVAVG